MDSNKTLGGARGLEHPTSISSRTSKVSNGLITVTTIHYSYQDGGVEKPIDSHDDFLQAITIQDDMIAVPDIPMMGGFGGIRIDGESVLQPHSGCSIGALGFMFGDGPSEMSVSIKGTVSGFVLVHGVLISYQVDTSTQKVTAIETTMLVNADKKQVTMEGNAITVSDREDI